MKTIGLIGGMSWESSLVYYRIINEAVKAKLGGLHSAKCIMYSVDFAEIEPLQHVGRWDLAAEIDWRALEEDDEDLPEIEHELQTRVKDKAILARYLAPGTNAVGEDED